MTKPLPSFRSPPVVETALSVQFNPIKGFLNAHMGLFWARIRGDYPHARDAGLIEPEVERFPPESTRSRFPQLRIAVAQPAARLQMLSADEHTMVQVQNGRFVYNWRRLTAGEYPRWDVVWPTFREVFGLFERFLGDEGLGPVQANQWEVTYVNHLLKGNEWERERDWHRVIPGLIGPTTGQPVGDLETLSCAYHIVLPDGAGRLHIDVLHGFSGPDDDDHELLVLQLTGRGGIDEGRGRDLEWGMSTGRRAIVESFANLTGSEAQTLWEREP